MGHFRGVVTNVGDGFDRLRLYRLDAPGRFVEFPLGAAGGLTEEPQTESMLKIHRLDISDGDFDEGFDSDDDIDQLFDEHARSEETFARWVARRDARDPAGTRDSSAFGCCYTIVYD